MGGRWFHIAVLAAWLLSMSWLFVEKLLPTFRAGQRPTYDAYVAEAEAGAEPAGWRLQWDEQDIGWAIMRSRRGANGAIHVRSVVHFESLQVDRIVTELLGTIGPLVRRAVLGRADLQVDVTVVTSLNFTSEGELLSFESSIHSDGIRNLMRVAGIADDGKLELIVYGATASDNAGGFLLTELYRKRVELPPDALVSDAFSPQPRLSDLRLGQRWTFPRYRPFPPGSPAEIIEAEVERETSIYYDEHEIPVWLVVYRREAGSGISADQEPVGRMWVGRDGTVLKQEVRVANLGLIFHRSPAGQFRQRAAELDPGWEGPGQGPQRRDE